MKTVGLTYFCFKLDRSHYLLRLLVLKWIIWQNSVTILYNCWMKYVYEISWMEKKQCDLSILKQKSVRPTDFIRGA